jgi:hypothetical protein
MKAHPSDKDNKFPSTAHLDKRGQFVHDKLNQPLAEHEALGNFSARDRGQQKHGARPGYCPQHSRLGCEECS